MPQITVKFFPLINNQAFIATRNNAWIGFQGLIPPLLTQTLQLVRNERRSLTGGPQAPPLALMPNWHIPLQTLGVPGMIDANFAPSAAFQTLPAQPGNYAGLPDRDKIQYCTEIMHWLKSGPQKRWLIALDNLAAQAINNIITIESGPDILLVFALPEFYFTYTPDAGHRRATTTNYSKPFYSHLLDRLFLGHDVAGQAVRAASMCELAKNNQNVLIVAGTMRWKKINELDHSAETIYNTMPAFSNKTKLWTKIKTSSIDGYFNRGTMVQPDYKKGPAGAVASQAAAALAPMPANVKHLNAPYLDFTFHRNDGRTSRIRIGLEICKDHQSGIMADYFWSPFRSNPHFQVVTAAGVATTPGNIKNKTKKMLLVDAGASPAAGAGGGGIYSIGGVPTPWTGADPNAFTQPQPPVATGSFGKCEFVLNL